jgi:hypothetical protein
VLFLCATAVVFAGGRWLRHTLRRCRRRDCRAALESSRKPSSKNAAQIPDSAAYRQHWHRPDVELAKNVSFCFPAWLAYLLQARKETYRQKCYAQSCGLCALGRSLVVHTEQLHLHTKTAVPAAVAAARHATLLQRWRRDDVSGTLHLLQTADWVHQEEAQHQGWQRLQRCKTCTASCYLIALKHPYNVSVTCCHSTTSALDCA